MYHDVIASVIIEPKQSTKLTKIVPTRFVYKLLLLIFFPYVFFLLFLYFCFARKLCHHINRDGVKSTDFISSLHDEKRNKNYMGVATDFFAWLFLFVSFQLQRKSYSTIVLCFFSTCSKTKQKKSKV
jgi:hypothetical protein